MSLALTGLPSSLKVKPSSSDDWCDSAATRASRHLGDGAGPLGGGEQDLVELARHDRRQLASIRQEAARGFDDVLSPVNTASAVLAAVRSPRATSETSVDASHSASWRAVLSPL